MKVVKIKLGELLEERGMTAYRLSKEAGISPNAISNLIHNKTKRIDFDTLAKICVSLDCEIQDILTIDELDEE